MKRFLVILSLSLFASFAMAGTDVYPPTLKLPADNVVNQMPNLTLSWNAIVGSVGLQYEVQVDTNTNFNSSLLTDTTLVLLTGYTTHNLLFGTKYYWRVRAIDLGQTSAWSLIRSFSVFNYLENNSPAISDTAQTPDVSIAWKSTIANKSITGVSFFDYEIDTTINFNSPLYNHGSVSGSTFTFKNLNLRFGSVYYWRVRARHSAGVCGNPVVWTKQTTNIITDLNCIRMLDAVSGYAVGSSGTILKTTDGGNTWTNQVSGTTKNLSSVYFLSKTLGFTVGVTGTILKGTGTVWTSVTSGTSNNLSSIFFKSKATPQGYEGYAVGDNGIILKTKTSGTKWYTKASGTTVNLTSVFFPSDTIGFAVGRNGVILKTSKKDTTWSVLNSGTTTDLLSVYFVNDSVGFAVGKSGEIIKTYNSGKNWFATYSGTSSDLYSISFADNKRGYIVGANGTMLKTTNGGLNWIQLNTGITGSIYSVSFPSTNTGFVCGATGNIMITNIAGTPWNFKVVSSPTLFSPTNSFTGQALNVTLKWNKLSGVIAYGYQVATDPDFLNLVDASETDSTSVNLNLIHFGIKYYWRINARTLNDTSYWSSAWKFTTISTVTLLSPANSSTDISQKPLFTWKGQSGIAGYELQVDSLITFPAPVISAKPTADLTSYQAQTKLLLNKTYYWRMRAFSSGAFEADTSTWSTWSFTTKNQTGVSENGILTFSIYPNPASGKVNIKLDVDQPATLQIAVIGLLGNTFISEESELVSGINTREIDISNLSKGIYVVRLTYDGKVMNHKLIIDR